MKNVVIRRKGSIYSFETGCSTLKRAMEEYRLKRSWIAEWWYK